jgi:hypothetical protein
VGGFDTIEWMFFIVPATYLIVERARERLGRRRTAATAEPAVAGGR